MDLKQRLQNLTFIQRLGKAVRTQLQHITTEPLPLDIINALGADLQSIPERGLLGLLPGSARPQWSDAGLEFCVASVSGEGSIGEIGSKIIAMMTMVTKATRAATEACSPLQLSVGVRSISP